MRVAGRAVTFVLLLAGCIALRAPDLGAQAIRGTLLERNSNQPVGLARVTLLTEAGDTVFSTLTSASGQFAVRSPQPGNFYLRASALGYRETTVGLFELGEGGEMTVEFRVQPAAIELEEILVSAQGRIREGALITNGFYERMQMGLGRFITPADIQNSHALKVSDLFFNIPRVDVVTGRLGDDRIVMSSPMGDCAPSIYVDNMLVSRDGSDLEMVAPLHVIEAIEVYRGASELPLQWGGTGAGGCGAIIIWTKGSG